MRIPILLMVPLLTASASGADAARVERYALRHASLEATRGSAGLSLQAAVQRKPATKIAHDGGGYRLLAQVQVPNANCGLSDLIFRDGFDPRMLAPPSNG